jgi:restriction system protein
MNKELAKNIKTLEATLSKPLPKSKNVFKDLRRNDMFPSFRPPETLTSPLPEPKRESFYSGIKELGGLAKKFESNRQKHEKQKADAENAFQKAWYDWQAAETKRQEQVKKAQEDHERKKANHLAEIERINKEVDEREESYKEGKEDSIIAYCSMILECSVYPEGFPQEYRVAYVPESRQLVVDYELPSLDVVPDILEYRYVKSKDEIASKARTKAEIKERYQDLVASITLRTVSELFEHDRGNHIDVIVFSGHINTVDKATGKDIRPCLISIRTVKENFSEIKLDKVDKQVCLRNLGAQVSPRASEAVAIKPIIEFEMVDKRFVEEGDVLSNLESRPNLMELNPWEFEDLVTNLFSQMGLESKLTRKSKDGGVDCVAFDKRPVVGGKVVIQAKRWKNTVGVNAVRDLYGTMMNEGANKGILVSTSGYGPDAFEFAKDKPIELIDGSGLLYYLEQVGVPARIIMPDEG